MKKEKWLLEEIDIWQQETIINEETAALLKQRYPVKRNNNLLIILFSIIGSLLIGTGIILMAAKNWYLIPLIIRVGIAFLPLIISQLLMIFVLIFKQNSDGWREGVAALMMASVFTVIAMIGQIFHLPGDFGTYLLVCGLLFLPAMYILNAISPLLVYYWAIINWGALLDFREEFSTFYISALLLLFFMGGFILFFQRNKINFKTGYITWLTVMTGFAVILTICIKLGEGAEILIPAYFVLLLAFNHFDEVLLVPFKVIGTVGGIITLSVFTYSAVWRYPQMPGILPSAMFGIILLLTSFLALRTFKNNKPKFLFMISLAIICIMRYCFGVFGSSPFIGFDITFAIIANIILFLVSIGFIINGAKDMNLLLTNIGMVTLCGLILMRFFDSEMDFFWRGMVFLALGTAFLLVNLKILSVKKHKKQEDELS